MCDGSPTGAHQEAIAWRFIEVNGQKQKQNYGVCKFCGEEKIYPTSTQLMAAKGLKVVFRRGKLRVRPSKWG